MKGGSRCLTKSKARVDNTEESSETKDTFLHTGVWYLEIFLQAHETL